MTVRWRDVVETRRFWEARVVLCAGLVVFAVLVLAGPLVMAGLVGTALPWDRLADIGEAFGGISAVLSAAALCGVGASLLYQQRQTRQELADIDGQHHMELIKLAIEKPELMAVLDARTASLPHWEQEAYANLALNYWRRLWELREIDEGELRVMVSSMFESSVSRRWWSRVGEKWIGINARPRRRQFLAIVNSEFSAADLRGLSEPWPPVQAISTSIKGTAAVVLLSAAALGVGCIYGWRIASSRRPAMNDRHESTG